MPQPIYLGTILLERNRWKGGREPTFAVSEWLPRIEQAGFDGLELWENHALKADDDQRSRLKSATPPVVVFNSYCTFDDTPESRASREAAAAEAEALGAAGIKFNLTRDADRADENLAMADAWLAALPPSVRPMCECHPGTILETPEQSAAAFARPAWQRVEAIVHPINHPDDADRAWFEHLGTRITHAHVQPRVEGEANGGFEPLDANPDRLARKVALLHELGFVGSFTLEFCAGLGKDEQIDAMFEQAVADLNTLRAALSQG